MSDIIRKLTEIQARLKAPKGQFNSFGRYKYRSCEDILESVKPLCRELNCSVTLNDELVLIGDRYYVKSIAALLDEEGGIKTSAYAREAETKKGMDESQITGSASSYARKYALSGLFAIDDEKDADTDYTTAKTTQKAQSTAVAAPKRPENKKHDKTPSQRKKSAELPADLQPAGEALMTTAQMELIEKMLKTHLISDGDKKKTLDAIRNYKITKSRAAEMIKHIKQTIDDARKTEKEAKEALPPDEVVPGDVDLSDDVYEPEPEADDFGGDLIEPTELEAARVEAVAFLEGSGLPAGAKRSIKNSIEKAETLDTISEIVQRIENEIKGE